MQMDLMHNIKEIWVNPNNMKILQNKKDGSAKIIFTDDEIKIINNKKGLEFDAMGIRQFSNHLVKIAIDINSYIPEDKLVHSFQDEHIESKKEDKKSLPIK